MFRVVTLPQPNIEPEKDAFKEDSSLYRTPFQAPCLFGKVHLVASHLGNLGPIA